MLDERAGVPSASDFERLLACAASARMANFARRLGQEAHQSSPASLKCTAQHLAFIEGAENLSESDLQEWELVREEVEAALAEWLDPVDQANYQEPQFYFEQRLWLSRYGKLVYSGKPDLVVVQGRRAIIFDYKFGRFQVPNPSENLQLTIYAVLVFKKHGVKEVRTSIASPFFNYPCHDFDAKELRAKARHILTVLQTFADAEAAGIVPVPQVGEQCHFCPGRLVCPAARDEAIQTTELAALLPEGERAGELLTGIERATALFKEVRAHYKEVLKENPEAIPGWALQPGYVRRSIPDLSGLVELMAAEGVEFQHLVKCFSVSVPEAEELWAKVKYIPPSQAKAAFKKVLGALLVEKQNEPFLKPKKNHQLETALRKALLN
jgi:hypothetical protein